MKVYFSTHVEKVDLSSIYTLRLYIYSERPEHYILINPSATTRWRHMWTLPKITLTSDQQFPQVEETFTSRTRYLIIFSCATSTKLWRPANLEMDLLDSARVIQYAEEIYTGPDFKAAMSKGRLTESPFVNRVCCAIKKDLETVLR